MQSAFSFVFISLSIARSHQLKPATAMTEQLTRSIAVPARQCLCGAGGMAWRQSPSSQDDEHRTTSVKTVVIQHQDRSAKFSVKGMITATVMALARGSQANNQANLLLGPSL